MLIWKPTLNKLKGGLLLTAWLQLLIQSNHVDSGFSYQIPLSVKAAVCFIEFNLIVESKNLKEKAQNLDFI